MAFNGSGVFNRVHSWLADKASNIKISASRMDAEFNGIAEGLSNCITRDGQSTVSADIPFNNKKITNLGAPTASTDAATKGYVDGSALGGLRNKIINGNFAINQRAVSGTVTLAAGAYGHDRWKAGASGCTYTFTTNGIDTHVTITSGSLVQVIEGAHVESGFYTLSWDGAATARIAISGGPTSGAYASGPITTNLAIAGQSITVEFTLGIVGKVQVEQGGAATAFERRPLGIEQILCRRYYQRVTYSQRGYGGTAGSTLWSPVGWTPMRDTPTVTYISRTAALNSTSISLFPKTPDQGIGQIVTAGIGDCYTQDETYALACEL